MTDHKRIFLMRHATSPSGNMRDIERPLSDHGKAEATHMRDVFIQNGFIPNTILCSIAQRTRDTLECLISAPDLNTSVEFNEDIYHGSTGDYMHVLQSLDSRINAVLLLAHNPVVPALTAFLSDEDTSTPHAYEQLTRPYVPATISVLNCPIKTWKDLTPRANALTHVIAPKLDA